MKFSFALEISFLALVVLTGCKQVKLRNANQNVINVMGNHVNIVRGFNYHGDDVDGWFSKKGRSSDFECYGYVKAGKVSCYIRNLSNHHVLMNHKQDGPVWAIRYLDSNGQKWEGVSNDLLEYNFPHLVALGRIYEGFEYSGEATSECIEFPLPEQCRRIVAIEIQLEYIPLNKLSMCDNLGNLRMALINHKCRIPVKFNHSN